MAKVNWSAGIDSVSGALSKPAKTGQHSCNKMLLGTHRTTATTSSKCNNLYLRKPWKRSTPLKPDEVTLRARFVAVAQAVANRRKDLTKITPDQESFLEQRDLPNGKKTMKAYLWDLEMATYDAAHPRS